MARAPDSLWWGVTRCSIWKYQFLTLQHQYYWTGGNVGMQSYEEWTREQQQELLLSKGTKWRIYLWRPFLWWPVHRWNPLSSHGGCWQVIQNWRLNCSKFHACLVDYGMLAQSISWAHKWDLSFWDGHLERDTGRCSYDVLPAICCTQKSRTAQRITSAWRVPLKERKRERSLGVKVRPWWMTMKEKRKRKRKR